MKPHKVTRLQKVYKIKLEHRKFGWNFRARYFIDLVVSFWRQPECFRRNSTWPCPPAWRILQHRPDASGNDDTLLRKTHKNVSEAFGMLESSVGKIYLRTRQSINFNLSVTIMCSISGTFRTGGYEQARVFASDGTALS